MSGTVEVRWATEADVKALYGETKTGTIRAKVATIDGVPVGLAGYSITNGIAFVFSIATEALKGRQVFIWRESLKFMANLKIPAWCIADENIPGAGRFLERLGWLYVGRVNGLEVYQWQSHQ